MYLRPEARGRGVGRQLLKPLLIAARQVGYQYVRLDTRGIMPAAPGSIAPPASLRAIATLRARSRWSSTIAASSFAAI
jgi:GNAT superfamily N-acetyltransferase